MRSSKIMPRFEDTLVAHVMDDQMEHLMANVAANACFVCVIFGGRLYNYDFFAQAIDGEFDAGVHTLQHQGSGGLLATLLSFFISTRPELRLFAHEYLDLEDPFPSCGSDRKEDLQSFLDHKASMPLNLILANGKNFQSARDPCLAIADICDGDAWLLVSTEL
jgi:hypothetical protein